MMLENVGEQLFLGGDFRFRARYRTRRGKNTAVLQFKHPVKREIRMVSNKLFIVIVLCG